MTVSVIERSDGELLCAFVRGREAGVFEELARRHVDWVYSAALRMTGEPGMAEDVTQGVMLARWRKAEGLQGHPSVVSWLFRATRFGASALIRAERRRKAYEAGSAGGGAVADPAAAAEWEEIRGRLEEAVGRLSAGDREAILLRFYERRTHPEIGEALRISEEAARKRVERAVEKLRQMLGVKSGAVLVGAMTASVVVGAPRHLAAAPVAGGASAEAAVVAKGIVAGSVPVKVVVVGVAAAGVIAVTVATAVVVRHWVGAPAAAAPGVGVVYVATMPGGNWPVAVESKAWSAEKVLGALQEREERLRNLSFSSVEKRFTVEGDDSLTATDVIRLDLKLRGDDWRITSRWESFGPPEKHVAWGVQERSYVGDRETFLHPPEWVLTLPTDRQGNSAVIVRSREHYLEASPVVAALGLRMVGQGELFSATLAHILGEKKTRYTVMEQQQGEDACVVLSVEQGDDAPDRLTFSYVPGKDFVLKGWSVHPFERHDGSAAFNFSESRVRRLVQVEGTWLPAEVVTVRGKERVGTAAEATDQTELSFGGYLLKRPSDGEMGVVFPAGRLFVDMVGRESYVVRGDGTRVREAGIHPWEK